MFENSFFTERLQENAFSSFIFDLFWLLGKELEDSGVQKFSKYIIYIYIYKKERENHRERERERERESEHFPDCLWFSLFLSTTLLFKMRLPPIIWCNLLFVLQATNGFLLKVFFNFLWVERICQCLSMTFLIFGNLEEQLLAINFPG